LLVIAVTLMTSFVTTTATTGQDNAGGYARNCVAHRSASCRETPFPINRMPVI
jgi:hypothetical protein